MADDLLYHYTNNKGLLGILTTGEIWMSDFRFLNDSQEWQWAGKIVARTIEAEGPKHKDAYVPRVLASERFDDFVRRLVSRFENPPVHFPYPYIPKQLPFIFSLSKKRNSLSQWRAYGQGEYCIAFEKEKLASLPSMQLVNVDYSELGVDANIAAMIAGFFKSHLQGIDAEVWGDGWIDIQSDLRRHHYFLSKKHPDFREECETRLISICDFDGRNSSSGALFFRDDSRYPTPMIRRKIFDVPLSLKPRQKSSLPMPNELIKEVLCGPGADRDRAAASFEMLNARYQLGIKVSYSDSHFVAEIGVRYLPGSLTISLSSTVFSS